MIIQTRELTKTYQSKMVLDMLASSVMAET